MVHKAKSKIPEAKFKVGEKVTVIDVDDFGNESLGLGIIKNRQYEWHPEYWGMGNKPKWVYSVENHPDGEKLSAVDIEGVHSERRLMKFNKKDWGE